MSDQNLNTMGFKANCQAFIINWHIVTENAKKLQQQFDAEGIETFVINNDESEYENKLKNWIHIGKSDYFYKQFSTALKNFNKEYLVVILGDVYDVNVNLIINRACYTFNKYDCGFYSPNVDFTPWKYNLKKLNELEPDLYVVNNPDILISFIEKNVLKDINLNNEKYSIGWGIDFLIATHAELQNKLVIRDYRTTITHPKTTGYSNNKAHVEYEQFINDQEPHISEMIKLRIQKAKSDLESQVPISLSKKIRSFFKP